MRSFTNSLEELTDFSIEILGDMHLAEEDADFCSFDETFDDVIMDEMMQLESVQQSNFSHSAFQYTQDHIDADETMDDAQFEPVQQSWNNNDEQFHDARSSSVETGPINGIHQFNSPEDLDGQIKKSMSKLVESMHRSEMSRNMLKTQQSSSSMFGLNSLLNSYSSFASGIAQHQFSFKNYMNHVGNSGSPPSGLSLPTPKKK